MSANRLRDVVAVVLMAIFLPLAATSAWALCVDVDGDGYESYDTGADHSCDLDCADVDTGTAGIHPAAAEIPTDGVDQDCDGLDYIVQPIEAALGTGVWWTTSGNVTYSNNQATLTPVVGTDAVMTWEQDLDWDNGEFHAHIGVPARTGSVNCELSIVTDEGTDIKTIPIITGEHDLASWDLLPPFTVQELEIRCETTSGGNIKLDYFTVNNGEYTWQPPRDQEIAWMDVDHPLGGFMSSVVRVDDGNGETLIAGSDNGGVAISTDGQGDQWHLVNGTTPGSKLDTLDRLAAWEVYALTDSDMVVATGRSGTGGLYRTTDQGQAWTKLAVEAYADDSQHLCDGGSKVRQGGKILTGWNDGTSDLLFFANQDQGGVGDHVGVYDLTSGAACDLGGGSPFLPNLPNDGIVSSLEVTTVGTELVPTLVVGFSTMDQAAGDEALWVCEISGTCSGGLTTQCSDVPASLSWDVRDLDVQLDGTRTLLYVADGGVRYDGGCSHEEGTIQVVELTDAGATYGISAWDSDTTTSGTCATGDKSGCPQGWHDAGDTGLLDIYRKYYDSGHGTDMGSGDLRVITNSAALTALTGVALQEDGWLFAIIRSSSAYAYPRIYRADVSTPPTGASDYLDWHPLQDYYTGEDVVTDDDPTAVDTNPEERASVGDDKGAWLRGRHVYDERELAFPDRPVDMTFYMKKTAGGDDDGWEAQVYGLNIYELPAESGASPGFDSTYGVAAGLDLDLIPYGFAVDPDYGDFQQTTVRELAMCEGCSPNNATYGGMYGEGIAFGAVGDHGLGSFYTVPTGTTQRVPGLMECHFQSFGRAAYDVDIAEWYDGTGATVWAFLRSSDNPVPDSRLVIRGRTAYADEEDIEDFDWCYEGGAQTKVDDLRAFDVTAGVYSLACQRSLTTPVADPSYPIWPSCDDPTLATGGEILDLSSGTLGEPYHIDALDPMALDGAAALNADVALATFISDGGPSYTHQGGLVLIYDSGSDMAMQRIGFSLPAACSYLENELFSGAVDVAIDQASSVWTDEDSYDLWAYLSVTAITDDDCAVFEVHLSDDGTTGDTATWTNVPIGTSASATGCTGLKYNQIEGVTTAPWAPGRAWVHGKADGPDAICEIDATGASITAEGQLPNDGDKRHVKSLAPHPQLADTLIAGMSVPSHDDGYSWEALELFQLAWRLHGGIGVIAPDWRFFRSVDLFNPNVTGIAFDTTEDAGIYDVYGIWVATSGSGVWEGTRGWRY